VRRRLLALPAAAVLALAACNGGTDEGSAEATDSDPVDVLIAAADTTREAGSARVALQLTGDAGGDAFEIDGDGIVDFDEGIGELTLNLPEDIGGITFNQIFTEDALYIRTSQTGDQYVEVTPEDFGAAGGFGQGLGGGDPSAQLDALRGVADDVQEVGSEDVRGTETTKYEGTLDLERAVAEAPEEQQEQVRTALEQLGTDTLPFEAYLDRDGQLRRFAQTIDLSEAAGTDATLSTTLDLYDFGVDVDVEIPSGDQLRPGGFEGLFGGPGAGAGGGGGGGTGEGTGTGPEEGTGTGPQDGTGGTGGGSVEEAPEAPEAPESDEAPDAEETPAALRGDGLEEAA
jgi:hypothetical protein